MKPNPSKPVAARRARTLTETEAAPTEHPGMALLAAALRRCSEPQRTMLALMLVERLSSTEAAAALGVSVGQFERSYQALIADLRRSMDRTNSSRWRAAARRATFEIARLRRAS